MFFGKGHLAPNSDFMVEFNARVSIQVDVCIVYFHLVHVIITSNVGIILDVQFIIMYTK